MSPVLLLGLVGIAGLIVGVFALRSIRRTSTGALSKPPNWRTRWIVAFTAGILLGGTCFFLTGLAWLSYPMSEPGGTGHVVGIPFIVAYIDAQGSDYVGAITWIGTVGNMVFWCLVPAIALWVHAAIWRRRNRAEQFAAASQ